jgi:hypothetical protein
MPMKDFLSFDRIEMTSGKRNGRTSFVCTVHSLLGDNEITLETSVELPHSDRKLSDIEREIAQVIHDATNPTRLGQKSQ